MKRILSLLLVFMISFSAVSFASEFNVIEPSIEVITNKVEDHQTEFAIQWSATDVKKGDGFTIGFPFDVKLPDVEGVKVIKDNGNYTFIFEEDFETVVGEMGGSKLYYKDEEAPKLVVNGKSTNIKPETPNYNNNHDGEHNTEGRDVLYKGGVVNGDEIVWIVTLGADGESDLGGLSVTDEIGEGHELIEDTVKITHYLTDDTETNYNQNDIIENLETTNDSINFTIKKWYPRTYIHLSYRTKVTDFSQKIYGNQLIVENKKKLTEKVEVKSWGDIDVERPDEPEEPEELPQVGEFFLKPQYLLALALVLVGVKLIKEE